MKRLIIIMILFHFAPLVFADNLDNTKSESPLSESTGIADDRNTGSVDYADKSIKPAPDYESLTLLFLGDIMGHDSQIKSALQPDGITYDYTSCFDNIREIISSADLAIGNLEVTLAGPPYKGYPRFSSPDALAAACKVAGVDVLVTANNHSCDTGKSGLERTIKTLDDLNIQHTGTFLSKTDKEKKSPLIIEKNRFKIAIINFTAETNGIPVPEPFVVNTIKIKKLKADIAKAELSKPDALILFLHWGTEYQSEPDAGQLELAEICFNAGVNIIIGSHPHVIQKSILVKQPERNRFVAYSLGNFISNQKKLKTNGGQMIKLTLQKKDGVTAVSKADYILTWVYAPVINFKKKFYVLPCGDYENRPEFFSAPEYYKQMKEYIIESRKLLGNQNENVEELK